MEAVVRPALPAAQALNRSRTRLLDLSIGLVEDVRGESRPFREAAEGFSDDFQICLPYRGLFVWHVGGEDVVGDPNQLLFVRGREPYRISGPPAREYAELIITPNFEVLEESLTAHPLFRRRTWRADPRMQSFRTRFLHWASSSNRDGLEADEMVLALLRAALQQDEHRELPGSATTARLIRRTKEFLQTNLSQRILLADVARAVGASPAYLTDLFTRTEGVSLHQYLTQLRLADSLLELPHSNDLTGLALDVGFSSHSHFTYAFRRAFDCTPSQFRESVRKISIARARAAS